MRKLLLAGCVVLAVTPALAQVYNPATPTGPPPILPSVPPQATPGLSAPPPLIGRDSRSDQGTANPRVLPGNPAAETSNDRAIRCVNQGTALGVPAGAMGQYVRECVNSR